MAWPVTRADLYSVDAAAWNELVNAFSAWGGNVNAGNNSLSNLNTINVGIIAPQSGSSVSIQAALSITQSFANPSGDLNNSMTSLSGASSANLTDMIRRVRTLGTYSSSGSVTMLSTSLEHGANGTPGTGHIVAGVGHLISLTVSNGGVIDTGYGLYIQAIQATTKWAIYDTSGAQSRLSGKLTVTGDITPSAAHFLLDNTYTLKATNSAGNPYSILGTYGDNITFIRALDNGGAKGVRIEQWDGTLIAFFKQGGNVGIGKDPATRFDVLGPGGTFGTIQSASPTSLAANYAQLTLVDTSARAVGVGGMIQFLGVYLDGGSVVTSFAAIQGFKEVLADNNYAGGVKIFTRPNGAGAWSTITPAVWIDSAGKLGLSVTPVVSGTGKFHHSGDTCRIVDAANAPANSAAAGNLGELRLSGGYLYYHDGTNWRRAAGSTF